jgi:hypothetical protein
MVVLFVCLTESKIRNLFRYANFCVKNFDFFFRAQKKATPLGSPLNQLANKLGNKPSG